MFDVGRSTCPQCLDGGVSRIQLFDLYIDVNTNHMHYAWQAGVRRSLVSFSIRLDAPRLRRRSCDPVFIRFISF
jgi:hypothetical protein